MCSESRKGNSGAAWFSPGRAWGPRRHQGDPEWRSTLPSGSGCPLFPSSRPSWGPLAGDALWSVQAAGHSFCGTLPGRVQGGGERRWSSLGAPWLGAPWLWPHAPSQLVFPLVARVLLTTCETQNAFFFGSRHLSWPHIGSCHLAFLFLLLLPG